MWYTKDKNPKQPVQLQGMAANLAQLRELGAEIETRNVALDCVGSNPHQYLNHVNIFISWVRDEVYSINKLKSFKTSK